jgi:hypothetical protein
MAVGSIFTNLGKKTMLNRFYKNVPDYTRPSTFKVGEGTTTPTVLNTDLETESAVQPVDNTYASGYPVLDETNMQGTIRCLVLTTDCNAQTLTEFGVFNTDATPKLMARLVHTAVAKTEDYQLIYIHKEKIKV